MHRITASSYCPAYVIKTEQRFLVTSRQLFFRQQLLQTGCEPEHVQTMVPPTDVTMAAVTPLRQHPAVPPFWSRNGGFEEDNGEEVLTWFRSSLHFWVQEISITESTEAIVAGKVLGNQKTSCDNVTFQQLQHSGRVDNSKGIGTNQMRGPLKPHQQHNIHDLVGVNTCSSTNFRAKINLSLLQDNRVITRKPTFALSADRAFSNAVNFSKHFSQRDAMGNTYSYSNAKIAFQFPPQSTIQSWKHSEKNIPECYAERPDSSASLVRSYSQSRDEKLSSDLIQRPDRDKEIVDCDETDVKIPSMMSGGARRSTLRQMQPTMTGTSLDRQVTGKPHLVVSASDLTPASAGSDPRKQRRAARTGDSWQGPSPQPGLLPLSGLSPHRTHFRPASGDRWSQRQTSYVPVFVSVLVRYFTKGADLNLPWCCSYDFRPTSASRSVRFRTEVDLDRFREVPLYSSRKVSSASNSVFGMKSKPSLSFQGMKPSLVTETLSVVSVPKREERNVQSCVHFHDSRRYKSRVDTRPVLTAVRHAHTVTVYVRGSSKRRYVDTVYCTPKTKVYKESQTEFVFPKNATHSFVSVLDYPAAQCRMWFKTCIEFDKKLPVHLPSGKNHLTDTFEVIKSEPDVSVTRFNGIIVKGTRDGAGASQVFIPPYETNRRHFEERQFRIRLKKPNSDLHSFPYQQQSVIQ